MTPIPVNPSVVVYVGPGNKKIASSSNIAPDLDVVVVTTYAEYVELTQNKPFDSSNPHPQTQVLAMRK